MLGRGAFLVLVYLIFIGVTRAQPIGDTHERADYRLDGTPHISSAVKLNSVGVIRFSALVAEKRSGNTPRMVYVPTNNTFLDASGPALVIVCDKMFSGRWICGDERDYRYMRVPEYGLYMYRVTHEVEIIDIWFNRTFVADGANGPVYGQLADEFVFENDVVLTFTVKGETFEQRQKILEEKNKSKLAWFLEHVAAIIQLSSMPIE